MLKENLDEFLEIQPKDVEDVVFVAGSAKEKKFFEQQANDVVAMNVAGSIGSTNEVFEVDFTKIIDSVASSMMKAANRPSKEGAFIDLDEIEHIKNSISDSDFDMQIISEVKNELTNFEAQIKENYSKKIQQISEEKSSYEDQIEALLEVKDELVRKRLSLMQWPFDEKTKMIDKKIEALKLQDERCSRKVTDILTREPIANEKDILIFKMKLTEKFA